MIDWSNLKQIIKLSFPIILGQLGQMLIVAGDVFVATKHSTHAVAAIGVAGGLINPIFLFGIGMTMGISSSFAFLRGKGKKTNDLLSCVLLYSLVTGFCMTFLMLLANRFVGHFGIEPGLVSDIQAYISVVSWSFPFAIVFAGLREFLQSFEEVMIPNIMALISVVVNLAVNYIFVFGVGDWEGLGTIGLAYASLTVRVLLFLAIMIYCLKRYALSKFSVNAIKTLATFSFPIAFMFFLEVLAFCTVTVLCGKISIVAAATNNIVMTLASLSFMVPLSFSSAAAVKIGYAFGAQRSELLKKYLSSILILIIGFSLFSVLVFMVLPDFIMHSITIDPDVIKLGVSLLFVVAIFQIFDAVQVTLAGVLRGMGETRFPSIMVFIGYWLVGIPFGIHLAFFQGFAAKGLWIGLAVSLGVVAIALTCFTHHKVKQLAWM